MAATSELTGKHADAHATHGTDIGNLKRPSTFSTHQTVPGLQTAAFAAVAIAAVLVVALPLRAAETAPHGPALHSLHRESISMSIKLPP